MFFNKKKNNKSNNFDLVKIAALLIHAARIDEKYSIEEEEIIKKTLLDLGTNQNELENIIKKAKQNEENTHQILDFTREIKSLQEKDKHNNAPLFEFSMTFHCEFVGTCARQHNGNAFVAAVSFGVSSRRLAEGKQLAC